MWVCSLRLVFGLEVWGFGVWVCVLDFESGFRDLPFSPGITINLGESLLFLVAL